MDYILLDGRELTDEIWQTRGRYSFSEITVGPGKHMLEIVTEEEPAARFGVYVYGNTGTNGGGFGYSLWPNEIVDNTSGIVRQSRWYV